MTSFSDWIQLGVQPMAAFDHVAELEDIVRQRVAKQIETKVRSSLDPGIDAKRATELANLKVTTEGSTFVIKVDDSQAALSAAEASVKPPRQSVDQSSAEGLFEMSSGVPKVDGDNLVFKSISLDALFGRQKQREQDEQIEHIVEDVARNALPDAYDEAFSAISRKYPLVK